MPQSNQEPQNIHYTPQQAAVDPMVTGDNHILQQLAAIRGNGQPVQAQQVPVESQAPPQPSTPVTEPRAFNDPSGNTPVPAETPQEFLDDGIDLSLMLEDPQPTQEQQPDQQTQFQLDQFEQAFKAKYGVDLAEAVKSVQEVQTYRQQQVITQQEQQVAQAWGVSADEAEARLNAVRERFSKYDPQKQATLSLDPIRGALLIWQQLERENMGRQAPAFDRTRGAYIQQSGPKRYTQAEIQNIPQEQYVAEMDNIINAYRLGLVQ